MPTPDTAAPVFHANGEVDLTAADLPGLIGQIEQSGADAAGATDQPVAEAAQLRNVLRVTSAIAQYDVSPSNPQALANLGKALAGCLDRDDLTFLDPETQQERKLGDVLVTVDLSDPEQIVLSHRDTAGKGPLGRVFESAEYVVRNPIGIVAMKVLGVIADPEVIYKQKVIQMLAQLDREGLFGPPGASTFNLRDWEVETRQAWRDVLIRPYREPVTVPRPHFGTALLSSFAASAL